MVIRRLRTSPLLPIPFAPMESSNSHVLFPRGPSTLVTHTASLLSILSPATSTYMRWASMSAHLDASSVSWTPSSRDTTSHSTATPPLLYPRQIFMRKDSQSVAKAIVVRDTPSRLRCINITWKSTGPRATRKTPTFPTKIISVSRVSLALTTCTCT